MLKLKVRKSAVGGSGIARVNLSVLESLGMSPGDSLTVRGPQKAIIVTVYGDTLVAEGDIRLRADDMARLGVRKGDVVEVEPYIPLLSGKKKRPWGMRRVFEGIRARRRVLHL